MIEVDQAGVPVAEFEAAVRRLEDRRQRREMLDRRGDVLHELAPGLEAMFDRLRERAGQQTETPCRGCRRPIVGEFCCEACCVRDRAREWSELPKAAMLAKTGCPELYREPLDIEKLGGKWPRSAAGVPIRAWSGDPPFALIAGFNGRGKSRFSAGMLYRAVGAADGLISSALWTTAQELVDEDRTEPLGRPRPIQHAARAAGAVVIDDYGWSADGLKILQSLCEYRHSRSKITIWTTHLRPKPLIQLSPMIARRIQSGEVWSLW